MLGCRAGARLFVFLEQGPLILVAVSTAGEPESWLQLHMQLLHGQLVSILTSSLERMFAKNPSYDLRALLGGRWLISDVAWHQSLSLSFSCTCCHCVPQNVWQDPRLVRKQLGSIPESRAWALLN